MYIDTVIDYRSSMLLRRNASKWCGVERQVQQSMLDAETRREHVERQAINFIQVRTMPSMVKTCSAM